MATDMTVRRVSTNTADIATDIASDMSTAALDPDKFKFLETELLPRGRIIVVWGYDST